MGMKQPKQKSSKSCSSVNQFLAALNGPHTMSLMNLNVLWALERTGSYRDAPLESCSSSFSVIFIFSSYSSESEVRNYRYIQFFFFASASRYFLSLILLTETYLTYFLTEDIWEPPLTGRMFHMSYLSMQNWNLVKTSTTCIINALVPLKSKERQINIRTSKMSGDSYRAVFFYQTALFLPWLPAQYINKLWTSKKDTSVAVTSHYEADW